MFVSPTLPQQLPLGCATGSLVTACLEVMWDVGISLSEDSGNCQVFGFLPGFFRLVEGKSRCSGRVEIHDGDQWKTVCASHFGAKAADVVCRELQCGTALPVAEAAHFGEGVSAMWDRELQCVGNESLLISCPRGSSREQPRTRVNSAVVTCTRKDSGRGVEHWGELQPEGRQVVPVETREVGCLFPQAGREVSFLGDP